MTDESAAHHRHIDPDVLAMMAMGEPDIPLADELHVQDCAECLDELNSLLRVATLARSGSPLDHPLHAPRASVWNGISRELGLSADVSPRPFVSGADDDAAARHPSVVVHTHRSRRPRRPLLVGGVIALAAGVAAATVIVAGQWATPSPSSTPPTVLAEASLTALPEWAGSDGEAVIERTASGRRVVVTVSESRKVEGYSEVWLISADLTKLISVGVLAGDRGTFAIPADVDLAEYPIVDVSQEKPDGDPAHSGDSIVRGTL